MMGLIALLTRWFEKKPATRPPPEYRPPRGQDDEDEEIAELIAIDIIGRRDVGGRCRVDPALWISQWS
jgi:hypothetical protein